MAFTSFFTPIFTEIDALVADDIATKTGNLMNVVSPLLQSCFAIYVLFIMFSYWQSGSNVENMMLDMMKRVFSWGLVLTFSLNVGLYNSDILPIILNLGDNLSSSFLGSTINASNSLDELLLTALKAINKSEESSVSLMTGFDAVGAAIASAMMNFFLLICMGVFLVIAASFILAAKIFCALLAILGPLYLSFFLFPATRGFATAWVGQIFNYSLLVLLVNITANFFINYMINSVQGANLESNQGVLQMMITSGIFTVLILKLPELASAISQGMSVGGFRDAGRAAMPAAKGLTATAKGSAKGAWKAGKSLVSKGGNTMKPEAQGNK